MIRSELLQLLEEENPGLRSDEIEKILDIFFDNIIERLAEGGRVELRGFGAFSTRAREPRKGRNPRTGEAVDVPAKLQPLTELLVVVQQRANFTEVALSRLSARSRARDLIVLRVCRENFAPPRGGAQARARP